MQVNTNDYQYDVFLSYKRNYLIGPWVRNFFLNYFEAWLTEKFNELGMLHPRVFFDERNIEPGAIWPQDLRSAIQNSKVLVAVCSPSYFQSAWCMSEWESFAQREGNTGITGLRIPIRHNDCDQHLNAIQWCDFYGYTSLAREFYQSEQAYSFERKVEYLAGIVARAVQIAPPFRADWPVIISQPALQTNLPMQRL